MKKLLSAFVVFASLIFSGVAIAVPSVSVTFALDESGSVSSSNFQLQTQGFINALEGLPTDGSVEISIIGFGSYAPNVLSPTVLDSTTSATIRAALANNSQSRGGTNIARAIDASASLLAASSAPTTVIILATDGQSNFSSAVASATNAKNAGIDIAAIGVGSGVDKNLLDTVSSDEHSPAPIPSTFEEFGEVVRNITLGVVRSSLNISLSPSLVEFGYSASSGNFCSREEKILVISNNSNTQAEIFNITFSGGDSQHFKILSLSKFLFTTIPLVSSQPVIMSPFSTQILKIGFDPIGSIPPSNGVKYEASINVDARLISDNTKVINLSSDIAVKDTLCMHVSDARLAAFNVDDAGGLINREGNKIDESFLFNNVISKPDTFARKGLVADGNSRLFITTQLGVSTGVVRFEINSTTNTGARLYPLSSAPTYSDHNKTIYDSSGRVTLDLPVEALSNGKGQVSAVLRAGESFSGINGDISTEFSITACLLVNNTCSSVSSSMPIIEKRAPVLLVHGLWASSDSFDDTQEWSEDASGKNVRIAVPGLKSELDTAGYKNVFAFNYDNWLAPNSQELSRSPIYLSYIINEMCDKERVQRIACSRADAVGHSLGGLFVREYIYSGKHSTFWNFNQGSIRRFLTLGTPHEGSGYGNLLTLADDDIGSCFREGSYIVRLASNIDINGVAIDGSLCELDPSAHVHGLNDDGTICVDEVKRKLGLFSLLITEEEKDDGYSSIWSSSRWINITKGGARLLGVRFGDSLDYLTYSSTEREKLNDPLRKQYVKHAGLVGDIGDKSPKNIAWLSDLASEALFQSTSCRPRENIMRGEDSDGIVPISSARFRSMINSPPQQGDSGVKLNDVEHTGMGQNKLVSPWVIERLNSRPLSGFNDFTYLEKESILSPKKDNNNKMLTGLVWVFTNILGISDAFSEEVSEPTLIANRTEINGAQELVLEVTPIDYVLEGGMTLVDDGGGNLLDDTLPYKWVLSFDKTITGEIEFFSYGYDKEKLKMIKTNKLSVEINKNQATLKGLYFSPGSEVVTHPGGVITNQVYGQYTDGVDRLITTYGTIYSENGFDKLRRVEGVSDVIDFSQDGEATGTGIGTAELVVEKEGIKAYRKIIVEPISNNDADGDGISDEKEEQLGTNKYSSDTDGDGVDDLKEVGNTEDPYDANKDGQIDAKDKGTVRREEVFGELLNGQIDVRVLPLPSPPNIDSSVAGCSIAETTNPIRISLTDASDGLFSVTVGYSGIDTSRVNKAFHYLEEFDVWIENEHTVASTKEKVTLSISDNDKYDKNIEGGVIESTVVFAYETCSIAADDDWLLMMLPAILAAANKDKPFR